MTLPRFVVQLHDATRLHYDLRLQVGDVLRSWAVPKGPSLDPAVRRLAVQVEDHSLEAGEFEGLHDGPGRGSGAVIVWDEGTVDIRRDEPDHLSFVLSGEKLSGRFGLTRTDGRQWILVKARDRSVRRGSDVVAEQPDSVRSGKTWQQLVAAHNACEDENTHLFKVVEDYSALGDHRTGTEVDRATVDWMEGELASLGATQVYRDTYNFERYDVQWETRIDGEVVPSIPLFYEGVGRVAAVTPATASLAVRGGSGIPDFAAFAKRAFADGQRAAVVATQAGNGLLCAVNRKVGLGSGLPTVCVAGALAERFADSPIAVDLDARIVTGTSANLLARIGDGRDEDRVLLTTPLSGWFRCAGERGTGIAVLLAVARALIADGTAVTVLVTNGHELSGLGVHRHLSQGHIPEKAVFHFGASVASGDADGINPPTQRTKMLRPSAWAGEAHRDELATALAPLGVAVRLPTNAEAATPDGWVGESAAWAPLGKPMVSIAGGFPLHHAPEDLPHLATTPALLQSSFEAAVAAARVLARVAQ